MPRDLTLEEISPQELDRLAEISPTDLQAARAAWKKDAPPELRNLLDATAPEEEEPEDGDES